MEQFKETIRLYWPQIVEYALLLLAYFLVFLFRGKVNSSHNDVKTLFKENVNDVIQEKIVMQKELKSTKQEYEAAIKKIESLERAVLSLTKALHELTDNDTEEVQFDAELSENETD